MNGSFTCSGLFGNPPQLVSYSLIVIVYLFFSPRLGTLLLIANSCEAICGPLTNSCYYCSVLISFFFHFGLLSQLISEKCKNKGNKGKKHKKKTKKKNQKKQEYKTAKMRKNISDICCSMAILRFLECACAQMYL